MYCQNCGTKIDSRFCPNCGFDSQSTETNVNDTSETVVNNYYTITESDQNNLPRRMCPKCRSERISYQTVTEQKGTCCLTILFYIFLAMTIVGLFILIPILAGKKDRTVTYAVCQTCGNRWRI